ncbi:glycosyltransferase [Lutibacter sp. A64]|uniref:glycosyltransferase family 2 protein n=1 Tax=Lutibacter sp. A64 TaxID=2918526 RepID=UPI001F070E3B|nr:glycosyltransferase [Lutibacter sp. A64]UMB54364.1 glycosyltransferase [Lutibacter sp. A64]
MGFNKIAVLLTCHNRKEKTVQCLKTLYLNKIPEGYAFEVFLVDDGSIDGTSVAIKEHFPQVTIIKGNGTLFWNQGMRLAWETAAKTKDFDFYLWLNDDTMLENTSLNHILECNNEIISVTDKPAIITGACKASLKSNTFSYGGRTEKGAVIPNGTLQKCTYINGNFVLVPKIIFKVLGNLASEYTHGMGDYDYGLRAIKQGFNCYTTKEYIAVCAPNLGVPGWCNPKNSLKKRWALLHSPLGLNIKEYTIFRRKFWGAKWVVFALKAYVKSIVPTFYAKISNN